MSTMTFEEFLRSEEDRELQRRQKRLLEEQKREVDAKTKREAVDVKELARRKKLEQAELKERIMTAAQERYEKNRKKEYDLPQPNSAPVEWLVFNRTTGELYGTATTVRAYDAWLEVDPIKLVTERYESRGEQREREVLQIVGYNQCRCVTRSDWEAAEAHVRASRSNGKANGKP